MLVDIGIECFNPVFLPFKTNPSDACWDIFASETVTIQPGGTLAVPTGLKLEIPECWEVRVRGKSGRALKGLHVHHGTIDHLYRQEVKVIITNTTNEEVTLFQGQKIAQIAAAPVHEITWKQLNRVTPTGRGGFGSTGL